MRSEPSHSVECVRMDLLGALLVGGLAGFLAGLLMKGRGFGIFGNVLVGVVGGVLGRWVFGLLGLSSDGGFTGSLITATVGAALLLAVAGWLSRKR